VGVICCKCIEINPAFSDFIKLCEVLEIYATHTRYPNRIDVNEQDAKSALENAAMILNFASEQIQQILI
jgi:hypothetical protein